MPKVLFVINAAIVDQELPLPIRCQAVDGQVRRSNAGRRQRRKDHRGQPVGTRVVVVEFPSREAFHQWYADPEYAGPLAMRLKATKGIALLVDGRE